MRPNQLSHMGRGSSPSLLGGFTINPGPAYQSSGLLWGPNLFPRSLYPLSHIAKFYLIC